MPDASMDPDRVGLVARIARSGGLRVAVAESLTSGRIASLLGAGDGAAEWFSGGVVAYRKDVKFDVLGVTPGPVVTQGCAVEMANGVRRLLHADVALGVTGVGGPGPDEDCPAGTVHIAVVGSGKPRCRHALLPGEPAGVVAGAADLAIEELVAALIDPAR
jgi:nicotinamide-nucleotide amidase